MDWFKELVVAYTMIFSDLDTKEAQELYLEACKPTLVDEMEEAVFVTEKWTDNAGQYRNSTVLILTKKFDGAIYPFYRGWSPSDFEFNFDYTRQQMYLSKHDYFVSQDVHDSHGEFEYSLQRGANRRIYIKSIEHYIIDITPSLLDKIYKQSPKVELPYPQGDLADFEDIYKEEKED